MRRMKSSNGIQPRINDLGDGCCGCGVCAANCSRGCITLISDAVGFLYPQIDDDRCVQCGACDCACPALNKRPRIIPERVFWAKAKDYDLLRKSSSGGIFGLLAKKTIADGGLVVGAAFADGCRSVRHVAVDSMNDLDRILRSKYVQSSMSVEIYRRVKVSIKKGRPALFSGTSCQVAAMKNYLGELAESGLFVAVDVICHGVPSPRLWSDWVSLKESSVSSEIVEVNFRSKTTGWSSYSVLYSAKTEKGDRCVIGGHYSDDWYMRAFLDNASLRPSCFACPSKRSCGSDITLGDFWGFQSLHPEVDSAQGVSAILCNTSKGLAAIDVLLPQTVSDDAPYEDVLAGNPALEESAEPCEVRNDFIAAFRSGVSISELSGKWCFEEGFASRLKKGFKRLLKHL